MIAKQKVVWNGEILHVPFAPGRATAAELLDLVWQPGPELGLFDADGAWLDEESSLPGGDAELTLRPVHLH